MDIWQIDKLSLFLIFFIPGFISIKIYDLLIPSEKRDFSKSIFEVIGFSAINFAALSWFIILIHSGNFYRDHRLWYLLALLIVIFVIPILWPIVLLKVLSWSPIAKRVIHPILKPWDYIFGKRNAYWVIIHLQDGRKIGGKYDKNSFASSYPAEEQIYLEEVWELDEKSAFKKRIDRSNGIIILGKDISSIEFFI
jgi:hypothetical protein